MTEGRQLRLRNKEQFVMGNSHTALQTVLLKAGSRRKLVIMSNLREWIFFKLCVHIQWRKASCPADSVYKSLVVLLPNDDLLQRPLFQRDDLRVHQITINNDVGSIRLDDSNHSQWSGTVWTAWVTKLIRGLMERILSSSNSYLVIIYSWYDILISKQLLCCLWAYVIADLLIDCGLVPNQCYLNFFGQWKLLRGDGNYLYRSFPFTRTWRDQHLCVATSI